MNVEKNLSPEKDRFASRLASIPGIQPLPSIGDWILLHVEKPSDLARKVNRQLLSATYLVALDIADGSLRWARHVASSGGLRRSGRPFSTVTLRDGDLFVSTAIGTIARYDGGTGMLGEGICPQSSRR